MPIRPEWRAWLGHFESSVAAIKLHKIDLHDAADAEQKSAALALFARMQSELSTAIILADAGRDLAFRMHCRSAVECALHLFLAETDASYLARLRADDTVSRKSRAKKYIASTKGQLAKEAEKSLQVFIQANAGTNGKLVISEIETPFPRMTHVYREISADATHVTWTSLLRHVDDSEPGWIQLRIEPKLTEEELEEAASILAFAGLSSIKSLGEILPQFNERYDLVAMFDSYKPIYRSGLHNLA